MALLCKDHLLCRGIGAECAPPIEVDQLFNGEVQRTIKCADTRPETIHAALDSAAPAGDGWGVRIRGSYDTLSEIGAFRLGHGGWLFEDPLGWMWDCVEVPS